MVFTHLTDERGFTFIELLVVMIVIGVLAAIALPAFLTQQEDGFDAEAKGNARNLLVKVESCFTETEDYRECDAAAELGATGLAFGNGPGEVRATSTGANSFQVISTSRGTTGGQHRVFTISKPGGGPTVRTCGPAAGVGEGGCPTGGVW